LSRRGVFYFIDFLCFYNYTEEIVIGCFVLLPYSALFSHIIIMIGIFDSGLGGLTVLKEIKKVLPEYDYLYLGDTLHLPYGNRSDGGVYDLTKNACDYLFEQGCKLIIIACNTATAKALRKLQTEYLKERQTAQGEQVNILGVVRPMVEAVAKIGKKKVGVIGTRGTVNSKIYMLELKEQRENQDSSVKLQEQQAVKNKFEIFQNSCPLLVPLIEEGWLKRKELKSILRYYLRPLKSAQVEVLILGCTHYPLLLEQIKNIMGRRCQVPNPGEIVAKSLKDYLQRHSEIENGLEKNSQTKYLVTDLNDNFQQLARRFLGQEIEIRQIDLK